MRHVIGIDIGGTTVKLGLFTAEGTLVSSTSFKTPYGDAAALFDLIAEHCAKIAAENGVALEGCAAGISVPGPVTADGMLEKAVNLGIYGVWPAKELEMRLSGVRVAAGNDANYAALGELWQGAGKGCGDAVFAILGTGIGGAVISGGRLISGVHGLGGELGHICVEPDEPEACGCGGHGCMEQYASATGIARVANRAVAAGCGGALAELPEITAKEVFDLAKAGDKAALVCARKSMDYLGRGLAGVCYVTDPEIVIIGGGVSMAGEFLLELLVPSFKKYAKLSDKHPRFVLAGLGGSAGMYGSAKAALDLL